MSEGRPCSVAPRDVRVWYRHPSSTWSHCARKLGSLPKDHEAFGRVKGETVGSPMSHRFT